MRRILSLIILLLLLLCGCADAPARPLATPAPEETPAISATPEPTPTPDHALSVTVVQTIRNEITGRQTESVFHESVSAGESCTVENLSGVWPLTFTVQSIKADAVTVQAEREMLLPAEEGAQAARRADTFTVSLDTPYRVEEPLKNIDVWYTFTFSDPLRETPLPEDSTLVRFTNRYIASNIRRTLHESAKSAFTLEEREMILFVELKVADVTEIEELRYLPNLETLTLKDTRVTDLSPLKDTQKLHTLVLLENAELDYTTMPKLPSLSTLSITGRYTQDDLTFLRAQLPDCHIIVQTEK